MPFSQAERRAWLRLARTENVGPVTFHNLMARFGTASAALEEIPRLASRGGSGRGGGKSFVFDNGEAEVLLGEDKAPNPVEWLLHALIGCMTTTTAYHAAARNIAVEAIDSSLDGDIDLRGFLGLSEEVRKGYSAIRVRMRVKTKASPATIKALTAMSPVFDTVSRSVPVSVEIETY